MSNVIRHVREEHPMPPVPDPMARIRALLHQRPFLVLPLPNDRPAEPLPIRSRHPKQP
ncbi:MAG: hypothetical protein H6Q90_2201 [Deltaproteobacteria bacterium]|nr:hypothetical protein [Deltaproteobacteria bacterium]